MQSYQTGLNVPKVLTDSEIVMVLKANGTVWLKEGGNPYEIVTYSDGTPLENVVEIQFSAKSKRRYAAVKADGTLWMWGNNGCGELGVGTSTHSPFPIQVLGLGGIGFLQNIIKVRLSTTTTFAVTTDGKVYGWGENLEHMLGSHTNYQKFLTPILINGVDHCVDVACIPQASMFLEAAGTVRALGRASLNGVRPPNGTHVIAPAYIIENSGTPLTNIKSITHQAALTHDGDIYMWGPRNNDMACVIDGFTTGTSKVAYKGNLLPPIETWGNRGSGNWTTYIAKLKTGRHIVWGIGGMKYNLALYRWAYIDTVADAVDFCGHHTTIFYKPDGSVWVAGENANTLANSGITGGSFIATPVYESVGGPAFTVFDAPPPQPTSIAYTLVDLHAEVFNDQGESMSPPVNYTLAENYPNVSIDNFSGVVELTPGHPDEVEVNASYEDLTAKLTLLFGERSVKTRMKETAGGIAHTIALCDDGSVYTCGDNTYGQLGNGTTASTDSLVKVEGLQNIVSVAAGDNTSFAIDSAGNVYAWGANNQSQLGDGTTEQKSSPVLVPGIAAVKQVAGGNNHTIAVLHDGTVYTWGNNTYCQLGTGTTASSSMPVQAITLSGISAVQAGVNFSLALKHDGSVYFFGRNLNGQAGNGTTGVNVTTPAAVKDPGGVNDLASIVAISVSQQFILALAGDGRVFAWGFNPQGQLGTGDLQNRSLPVEISGVTGATAIAAGQHHSQALLGDGTILSWGLNTNGQLGDGTTTRRLVPVAAMIDNVAAIGSGNDFAHAVKLDRSLWAWGRNNLNQIGVPGVSLQSTPVEVNIG